jgi:hypothetical protein
MRDSPTISRARSETAAAPSLPDPSPDPPRHDTACLPRGCCLTLRRRLQLAPGRDRLTPQVSAPPAHRDKGQSAPPARPGRRAAPGRRPLAPPARARASESLSRSSERSCTKATRSEKSPETVSQSSYCSALYGKPVGWFSRAGRGFNARKQYHCEIKRKRDFKKGILAARLS